MALLYFVYMLKSCIKFFIFVYCVSTILEGDSGLKVLRRRVPELYFMYIANLTFLGIEILYYMCIAIKGESNHKNLLNHLTSII